MLPSTTYKLVYDKLDEIRGLLPDTKDGDPTTNDYLLHNKLLTLMLFVVKQGKKASREKKSASGQRIRAYRRT